jgi:Raf kinase inhibitor-like YbhB/YbcL family protein
MRSVDPSPPPVRRGLLAVAAGFAVLAIAACSDDGRSMREPGPDQTSSIITTTVATAPADGGASADSGSALPSVAIETTPSTAPVSTTAPVATTAAASVDSGPLSGFTVTAPWPEGGAIDPRFTCTGQNAVPTLQWANVPPDAAELAIVVIDPDAGNFVHWVVAGISPGVTAIADGQLPAGAVQGLNGAGTLGWMGPCPPAGESHTYRFEVHALSKASGLTDGTVGDGMLRVIDGDTLETALTIGVFPGS